MNDDSTLFGDYKNVTEGTDALSRRQLQVLVLVAEGATDHQIARCLGLSTKTVGHYVTAILARLDACSRTQAVVLAMRQGLLPGHPAPEQGD